VKIPIKDRLFLKKVMLVALGVALVGYVGVLMVFAWYSKDLPTPTRVVRREGFTTRIYDRNEKLLYDVYKDAKRDPVTWEEVPESLKKATVAVEDKDFYKHQGFDPLTPFRIVKNIIFNHRLIGGSTLTQQLVKNVLLTSERSVNRKIREFILAVQIEARYSKNEILLMYLNEAPYGGTAWGVGTASEQYFGKPVTELNLTEAAILAGMPQRPNSYSPYSKTPKAYVNRTAIVLSSMKALNYISGEQEKTILESAKNYSFRPNRTVITAPHFVFWILDDLEEKFGAETVNGGGLKVKTTLDGEWQAIAEKVVGEEIDKAEKLGVSNGAAVVLDPQTGEVRAMVGSRDYFSDKTDGQFNVVTQGLRQPGSAIKPITYLAAIRKGWTAGSLIMDTPVTFPGSAGQKDYSPNNYNGKFNGPMTLRTALGNSINTTAVKMLANVGLTNMLKLAYDMGISTFEPSPENLKRFGLAVTLGGAEVKMIEMATAYSSFANGGKKVEAVGILKVTDRNEKLLYEFRPIPGKEVITSQEAFIVSNILSDNSAREITFGQVNGLIIPNRQVAVKTGTTNDKKDNWAIGWTPNLLVAAWVGNNDNTPMLKVASGVSGATPIWKRITTELLAKLPKQDFPIPDKIVAVEVDRVSGYPAHDGFASRNEYFIDGTQPKNADPIHMKVKICRGASGLATPQDVANGNYDEREYFKFTEEDKVSTDGKNRWQEGIVAWINQQADKDKYNPPSNYCRSEGMVVTNFEYPSDRSTVSNQVEVKISTTSLVKITEVKLWVDGEEKKTWSERPFEVKVDLTDGPHTLKAKATDKDGNTREAEIKIGVNVAWDWSPSPTPTNTPIPSPSPTVAPTVPISTATTAPVIPTAILTAGVTIPIDAD